MKYLILLIVLFSFELFASRATTVRSQFGIANGIDSRTNYVINPSAFKNVTSINTSSASVAVDTDASDKIDGISSALCDSSSQNGYCEWLMNTINEGDKTGNCEAKAVYKGDASLYKLSITDLTNTLASSSVLSNASDWTEVSVNYPCGTNRSVRLVQTEAGTGAAVNVGRVYYGKATNIGYSQSPAWYIDATLDGGNPSLGTASVSSFTEIIDAGLTLKPQAGSSAVGTMCSTTNPATAPSTSNTTCAAGSESVGINFNIPYPGTYRVCFYGSHWMQLDQDDTLATTFQLIETPTDAQTLTLEGGTRTGSYNSALDTVGLIDDIRTHMMTNCSLFTWSSSGIKGVRLMFEQSITNTPDVSQLLMDASASAGQRNARWTVEIASPAVGYGTQQTVNSSYSPWYVSAYHSGASPDLGISTVASYTEVVNASLTLTPDSGSAAVGTACSTTNAATAPSTSATTCAAGSEGIGLNFNIPAAGAYKICTEFTAYLKVDSAEEVQQSFVHIETPSNAQTVIQTGSAQVQSAHTAETIASGVDAEKRTPVNLCTILNFSSSGNKTVRLMYQQSVAGTPDSSLILADAAPKKVYWTVMPVTQSMPMPLLIGSVSSNTTGMERVERAKILCSSSSSVTSQSGSWISSVSNVASGACTVTIASGIFSSTPSCTANLDLTSTSTVGAVYVKPNSSTSITLTGNYVNSGSSTVVNITNDSMQIICMGPR